ncbi:ABC transporter permease [Dactylosporangium sp. CA-233914]|uniref:ABC transporter permease n=1 Tax=Dactylosporangium sp. CA-233914 TaxID=3239934 RepID=UPI003D9208C1
MPTDPRFWIGATLLAAAILIAALFPLLSDSSPYAVDVADRLQGPSAAHPFGTDDVGRDVFTRVIYGLRTSLLLGAIVAFFSGLIGAVLGLLAGYFRILDQLIMRACDGFMAVPGILLALALAASFGPGLRNVVIALVAVFAPSIARVVRSRTLSVKEELFVEAIRAQGASAPRILLRHIFPNTINVLVVQLSFVFAETILVEAALSFLGVGVSPPIASLGNIIFAGKQVFFSAVWTVAFPSLALVVVVIAINLLADALRDTLDPRSAHIRGIRRFRRQFVQRREVSAP